MSSFRIIGIDPGYASGAVACIGDAPEVHDMPIITGKGINVHALAEVLDSMKADHAFIEHVASMPRQGVSTTFKFGYGVGQIHAAVALAGVPYTLVTPAVWKRHHKLGKEKEQSRNRALQLFPSLATQLARKKDADRAEALLIAAYGQEVTA